MNKSEFSEKSIYYVPLFKQSRANLNAKFQEGKSSDWIPLPTNLQFRYEFASLSLQERGIFVAILLLCGSLGTPFLTFTINYLANLLSCDRRTLKKCLEKLEKNFLLSRIEEKEIEKIKEIDTSLEFKQSEKSKNKNFVYCDQCFGEGQVLNGTNRLKACSKCNGTRMIKAYQVIIGEKK